MFANSINMAHTNLQHLSENIKTDFKFCAPYFDHPGNTLNHKNFYSLDYKFQGL